MTVTKPKAQANKWKTKPFQAAKKNIIALGKKGGEIDFKFAKELALLSALCANSDEFRRFAKDAADGLGFSNGAFISAREKVDALQVVPEQKLWEALGWAGGVRQIWKIPKHAERVLVHKEVRARITRGGVTKTGFREILATHAPSLKIRQSNKRDEALTARLKTLEDETKMWKRWIRDTSKKIPVLKDLLTKEQKELLG
jgi:hypothetical protein